MTSGRGGGGGGSGEGAYKGASTSGARANAAWGGLPAGETAGAGLPSSVPARVVHPLSGVFDVVVVHASPADILPDAKKLLSGRPIYSVYLKVGTPKEWMLQYCLAGTISRPSSGVVQLGNPTPLTAPYPKVTVLPPLASLAREKRAMLHGYLNDLGQFRDLRAVATGDAEFYSSLAPFLGQWEFKPATRDGKPVEVELLLVVPPLR